MNKKITYVKQVGARIKAIRLAQDLKQCKMAKEIGIPQSQLSKIENGENILSETLLRIIVYLNNRYVSTDVIFNENRFKAWEKGEEQKITYINAVRRETNLLKRNVDEYINALEGAVENRLVEMKRSLSRV